MTHGGLPYDETQPLLGHEDVCFLDVGEREVRGMREVELFLKGGVGCCAGHWGRRLIPGVDK